MRPVVEHDIEEDACDYAALLHLQHRKLAWVGRKGAPDRIFWGDGVLPFMIEFKKPGVKLDRKSVQAREVRLLRNSGMQVYVCDNLAEAKHWIDLHAKNLR